ncbi:MAG: tetratricopeptide (TPR) repeat protein [Mariniblastus sp.]|jgi:tetratricopeptide (TPR) repeat protein
MNAFRNVHSSIFVILPAILCLTLGCGKRQPTVQQEIKAEKNRTVAKSFSGSTSDDLGEYAESLKRFFDECGVAMSSGDPKRFVKVFDSRMTFRLLKQQKMLPSSMTNEERMAREFDKLMPQRLADPTTGLGWEKYEIRRVEFIKDDSEAVVYVRHWDADGIAFKMRWWLIRNGDRWRAYDFEWLEVSMRFSVTMGIGFKMVDQDDPSGKRLPELMMAVQEGLTSDVESAMETLQDLDGVGFPPVVESLRLMMLAVFLADDGEYEQALERAKGALAINPDMPLIHLIKSACYNGLLQHEKAMKSAERYAKLLGRDGDYFVELGDAQAGLGEKQKAIDAYRNGLEDDPQSGNNVLGLLKILPDEQRDAVIVRYKALIGVDEWFVSFSETLLQKGDTETLRVLIDIHRKIMPDDENIPFYEEALAEF